MANSSQLLPESAPQSGTSWTPYFILAAMLYPTLCSYLRFRRRNDMAKKFNFPTKESLSKMTNVQAQEITRYVGELEFPKMYVTSLQFALFQTYGIPTISQLLAATREFSTPANASKRYADTTALIAEFTGHHPHSERSLKALARMNYIHSQYQKAGKISNEDLLYTLSLFIKEPVRWVKAYEWRPMTDMEVCAVATLWKSIGDGMGIQYKGVLAHSEWVDGLDFYHDICDWANEYEEKYMVPAQSNKKTAEELVPLLLFLVPDKLKPAAAHMVGVLMGDRLRTAMIYPEPPRIYHHIVTAVFSTRRFILRYLSLPRPDFMYVRQISDNADPKTGRYFMTTYQAHPYYNKPGFLNRWGPEAWFVWASGGDVPGSKGEKYVPEGYKFEEVGPKGMKNKGLEEFKAGEEKLKVVRPAGCPFAFAR